MVSNVTSTDSSASCESSGDIRLDLRGIIVVTNIGIGSTGGSFTTTRNGGAGPITIWQHGRSGIDAGKATAGAFLVIHGPPLETNGETDPDAETRADLEMLTNAAHYGTSARLRTSSGLAVPVVVFSCVVPLATAM
jgi:hypothetical protein